MTGPIPWRDHLRPEECAIIEAGDAAKAEWQRLNMPRAGIVNRAIRRARYAAEKASHPVQGARNPTSTETADP